MTEIKETSLSLQDAAKESIRERLEFLLRGRSKSNVARAWGLPFSTLNNYFEKGAIPSLLVAMQIAKAEGVSIDWLVYGSNVTKELQQAQQDVSLPDDQDMQDLNAILRSLDPVERKKLARLLGRKGAEVLALLLEQGGLDLLKLSGEQRTAALSLQELPADRVREILLAIKQCSTITEEVNYKYQASA